MTDIYEMIGWLALALNVWGNLALAKKSNVGWIIRLACNIAFIIYSYEFDVRPLLVNHIIFAFVNVYGWYEWTKWGYICSCGRKYYKDHKGRCQCELPIRPNNKFW